MSYTNCAPHWHCVPRKSFSSHLFLTSAANPMVVSQFQVLLRCKSGPEVFPHLIGQLKCDIRDRRVVDFALKVTGIWRHIINGAFWLSCAWCLPSKPQDSSCLRRTRWDEIHNAPNRIPVGKWTLEQGPLALGCYFTKTAWFINGRQRVGPTDGFSRLL